MPDLITNNPAIDAFNTAYNRVFKREADRLALEQAQQTQQGRIAGINADNATKVANSTVAAGTADARINIARQQSEQANAATAQAQNAAKISTATVDDTIQQTGNQTRISNVNANEAENRLFYQVIEAADQGDLATAQLLAQRNGIQIPEGILENRTLTSQLNALAKQAQGTYPNNPQRQRLFMQEAIKGLTAAQTPEHRINNAFDSFNDHPLTDPTFRYNVPNAPEAPTNTLASGRGTKFQQVMDAAKAIGYSEQEAFALANGDKPPSLAEIKDMARQVTAMEYQGSFSATPEEKQRRMLEVEQQLVRELLGSSAQSAAPAGQTTSQLPGSGTRNDPYQATTQEHVDWFKTQAPAGSVIIVNGKTYTK